MATDFSPIAENAALYAAELALAVNAELLLFHVYQAPVTIINVPIMVDAEAIKKNAIKEITQLKTKLENHTNNLLKVEVMESMGLFFSELERVCEDVKPYAVVMGSQGSSASERIFFGSETLRALKKLEWPLITIPPTAKFSGIKKIGLACDLESEMENTVIEKIKGFVQDFKAELHIINAGNVQEFKPDVVFESSVLERKLSDVKPKFHFITADNREQGILSFAQENKIDLLLTLPQSHSFLERLISSSVSKKIIMQSLVPVLSLHP